MDTLTIGIVCIVLWQFLGVSLSRESRGDDGPVAAGDVCGRGRVQEPTSSPFHQLMAVYFLTCPTLSVFWLACYTYVYEN